MPIDQIPLLELKNVIHTNKQLRPACDANFRPCSTLLVMIAQAEIKRRLSDLNDPMKEVEDGRLVEANDQPSGLTLYDLLTKFFLQTSHRKAA